MTRVSTLECAPESTALTAAADGYELIRALRRREEDAADHIPAIALTGMTGVKDRVRMLSAGFQIHVP